MQKIKDLWTPPEDEYDYNYDNNQDGSRDRYDDNENQRRKRTEPNENKVVNIHATAQLQVVLFKPERFGEETRVIADELLKTHTVVLNLENTGRDATRRILDFLSGVAYAGGGKIKRVATGTFIITPYNVDLTGDDILDELESNGVYF
jgi:cell division inhibitor SepF